MTISTLLKTGTLGIAAGALTALLATNSASGLYEEGRRYAEKAITTIMYPTVSRESMEELNHLHQTFQNYLPIALLKIVQSEECDAARAVLDVLQIINPDKPNQMKQILPSYDRIREVLRKKSKKLIK